MWECVRVGSRVPTLTGEENPVTLAIAFGIVVIVAFVGLALAIVNESLS